MEKEVTFSLEGIHAVNERCTEPNHNTDTIGTIKQELCLHNELCDMIKNEFEPADYSDVGQATLFVDKYGDKLRFNASTDWLFFDGIRWKEDRLAAQKLVHELTDKQIEEAEIVESVAWKVVRIARESDNKPLEMDALSLQDWAKKYRAFAVRWRNSARIAATLAEAAPSLGIDISELDKDAFLLNTPGGTVDLRTGEMKPNDPKNFCTKVTGCTPSDKGKDEFLRFLDSVTCGDAELQNYLQQLAGMFAVGAVYQEALVIAEGQGGNGKSTYFNLLLYVLGDYAGMLASDVLIANSYQNKKPDYAELRGKRLVIAAELEEGMKLDTATVKKICSTDPIQAEEKYRAPFSFVPSHSVVLYTNHLPRVATVDKGTWDRLKVIPFNANFRGQDGEIMNYAKHLFASSGGAVLSWMIEGAKNFIASGFKLKTPSCISDATSTYREESDTVGAFLDSNCTIGENCSQPSGALYASYRHWCEKAGEPARSSLDFKRALVAKGYTSSRTKRGIVWRGFALKFDYEEAGFVKVEEETPWSA